MDALTELEPYRGRRWECKRGLGDDRALLLLHKAFDGNAREAGDFLGFRTGTVVMRAWAKLQLASRGREAPRRNGHNTHDGWQKYPTPPISNLRERYLALSQLAERAYTYDWRLPKRHKKGILVAISDLHIGAMACDYGRFLALRDWIAANRNARWILAGDNFDTHVAGGPGSSADQFCGLKEAMQLLTEDLSPIVSQGICIADGNHEQRIKRTTDLEWSPSEELANRLGMDFIGLWGHIVHTVGEQRYTHYHHHGRGAARTPGAKLNTGLQIAATVTDELVMVGHLHEEISIKSQQRMVTPENTVTNTGQRLAMLPAFYDYRGYPADRAFRPAALGASAIELYAHEHQIRVVE